MDNTKLTATVNNVFSFEEPLDGDIDFREIAPGRFHVIKDKQTYLAEIIAHDPAAKTFALLINGARYQVNLSDQYDRLAAHLGFGSGQSGKVQHIKAPMPGLIVSINVSPGQSVKKGDALAVLEAMKMENILKSPGEGVVKNVLVQKGAAIDKGQVLIEME